MSTMNVGYLTGEFPRATDTWIQREIRALRAQDVEVTTFSVRRPGREHLVGPEQEQGYATTTYLLELAKSGRLLSAHAKVLARNPSRYLKAFRLAMATKRPGFRGGLYQLFYLAEAVVLADELRRLDIEHLHNHFGDSSCTVAMLASEVSGIPFSFTLHGHAIFFEPYTWHLDEKIRRASFCACISRFCRSQAAMFAPDDVDKLHIIHCGVEPERLSPVVHADRGPRLLFVGRVAAGKGVEVLLPAMAELKATEPDVSLTVVGDGPERAKFEAEANALGVGDCVRFVGSKSQSEVAELLSQHDIFVLPSFAEGVPVVLMEAMGAGLAVVASLVGGMTELIDDGETGLLVRPFDQPQLVDRVRSLINNPGLRQKLGDAGRVKVMDEFVSADEATRLAGLFSSYRNGIEAAVRPALPASTSPPMIETS